MLRGQTPDDKKLKTNLDRVTRKRCLAHARTVKTQISLRITQTDVSLLCSLNRLFRFDGLKIANANTPSLFADALGLVVGWLVLGLTAL